MKVRSVFHPGVACLGPGASLTNAASLMRAGEFGSVADPVKPRRRRPAAGVKVERWL